MLEDFPHFLYRHLAGDFASAMSPHAVGDHQKTNAAVWILELAAVVLIEGSDSANVRSRDDFGVSGVVGDVCWPGVGVFFVFTQSASVPPFLMNISLADSSRGSIRDNSTGF